MLWRAIGLLLTELFIDTAPEQGALGDGEFAIDGDMLTITWLSTNQTGQTPHHVDTFRRRAQPGDEVVLLHQWRSTNPTRQLPHHGDDLSSPLDNGGTTAGP